MDALASLLDGPRAQEPFLLRCVMDPPWSLRIEDEAPLTVVAVTAGEAWLRPDVGPPLRLQSGDVGIVRGPDPYAVASDATTSPRIVIGPGQQCTTLRGEPLQESMRLGLRTWGNSPAGATTVLVGVYQTRTEVGAPVLRALPPMLSLSADSWECPLVGLLGAEMDVDRLGQQVVLNRLLDLLVIEVLRAWFERADAHPPAWYRAQSDPMVGAALRLLQDDPARPWTVASLAAACSVSRAGLARHFSQLVGEPPMAYLTALRLALAADLLLDRHTTIGAVASQVGYSSPFALSAAFKRVRGASPRGSTLGVAG